jgi:hypothetical protein
MLMLLVPNHKSAKIPGSLLAWLPSAEGLSAFNVLQAKDALSKLLSYPDENYLVSKPENSLVV